MKLGYELTIEQTQKLTMTPELIQAIQILQYNNQELNEYIENELLENPVLEVERSEEDDAKRIDIDELRDKIVESNYDLDSFRSWEQNSSDRDEYSFEQYVAFKYSLIEHLLTQLHFSDLKGKDAEIGRYIIEGIDDNGYLVVPTEEIIVNMETDAETVERVLDVIHTFDPVGVGARNLQECLLVQLKNNGHLNELTSWIVREKLTDLAGNRITQLAREAGVSVQEMSEAAEIIKALEPKPGRLYDSDLTVKYVIPDVYVEKVGGEYVVTVNDSSSPHLMISSYYSKLSGEARSNGELNKYLNDRFNSAMWLLKSIEQRKRTIYNVASAIVSYQKDFFDYGERYLKPLTLKQIAEKVGVHESTVSRSINGKYMQSAMGVLELKYFFTSGVVNDDGTGVSSNSIKSMIREIVDGENPNKPYSDLKIANMLGTEGIEISRRTVAKYREDLGILSSSRRRKF
ncbi:MAG: RNA polymerase factor sigma-54 [Clostridia bacterium]|nr:RNA polymerase factor sigma-54 [Clostridia bacterium]